MSSELRQKLEEYRTQLEQELEQAKKERQVLIDKVIAGEILTLEENQRNKELVSKIETLHETIEYFEDFYFYESIEQDVNILSTSVDLEGKVLTRDEKDALITSLVEKYKMFFGEITEGFKQTTNLTDEEIANLKKTKQSLKNDIQNLQFTIGFAEENNNDELAQKAKIELDRKNKLIEAIDNYQKFVVDEATLAADLRTLSLTKTKKAEKKAIIQKYTVATSEYKNFLLVTLCETMGIEVEQNLDGDFEIVNKGRDSDQDDSDDSSDDSDDDDLDQDDDLDLDDDDEDLDQDDDLDLDDDDEDLDEDDDLDNESLLDKTKRKLKAVGKKLKENSKKVFMVGGAIILSIAIMIAAKGCTKEENKNQENNQPTNEPGIESLYDVDKAKVSELTAKGYQEFAATQMVANFPQETIDNLLYLPYIPEVENYATEKAFNLDYINDYEAVRETYIITADKVVDYVNRAHQIQPTNFYEDATIEQIVEVLMAIDNKELFTADNANLAQSFNTSFNRIVDNYLFGTTTEEDLTKLDALQYFAKEGSDLDNFLTQFGTLSKSIISNPEDTEARAKMYDHVNIFATSVNGYTNEPSALTSDETFNENAIVNDYFDWFMAYNSFIAPLYPTYSTDETFTKFEELQMLMISAMQGPEFEQLCGESLKLTGSEE